MFVLKSYNKWHTKFDWFSLSFAKYDQLISNWLIL